MSGLASGIGISVDDDFSGIGLAALGLGAGGRLRGLLLGGLGAGAGEGIDGVVVGGLGAGTGGPVRGLVVGGRRLEGVVLSGIGAGGREVRGLVVAPAYFTITEDGSFRGVSISAFNRIRGRQEGLSIGLLNIAEELHGVQIGLINIAWNKRSFRVMPLVNYNR